MAMNLLEIVQTVCAEIGLQQPTAVVSSVDVSVIQLWKLVNREGNELRKANDWTALDTEFDIAVSQPTVTTGNTHENSPIISGIPDTAGLAAGLWQVSADSVPGAARILSVDSATQITMTMNATAASTGGTVTFAKDTYAAPSDFDHYINRTWWDRTNRWELIGPDSPQRAEWQLSGIIPTGPRRHFRNIGPSQNNYRIWPPPGTLDTPIQLAFEYISKNWVINIDGTYQSSMTADTDQSVLDDQAIILGVKWRWAQIKQFDYAPMQQEYNDYVERMIARDGGAKTLSLSPRPYPLLIGPGNVPDGNWPGS
jgi:hypothetical protein